LSILSLGVPDKLNTAWIDRSVDTQGCALCFQVITSAAWKRTMLKPPRPGDLATSALAP
jgi:hypothetical protein